MRVYAIGDIHGQLEMLQAAHDRIAADRAACGDPTAPVVHLGDFCDRGPNTAGVLDFLSRGIAQGEPWRAVLGNHDRLFRDFVADGKLTDERLRSDLTWLSPNMGGSDTLRSYGIMDAGTRSVEELHDLAKSHIPTAHRRILEGLELFIETDDLFLVHAGIRPGIPLGAQVEDDLVWIREPFLSDTGDHGRLIVHGHTPVDAPMHAGNRVDLDTGAGFGHPMTAAVFEGRDCYVLEGDGRRALPPPR